MERFSLADCERSGIEQHRLGTRCCHAHAVRQSGIELCQGRQLAEAECRGGARGIEIRGRLGDVNIHRSGRRRAVQDLIVRLRELQGFGRIDAESDLDVVDPHQLRTRDRTDHDERELILVREVDRFVAHERSRHIVRRRQQNVHHVLPDQLLAPAPSIRRTDSRRRACC